MAPSLSLIRISFLLLVARASCSLPAKVEWGHCQEGEFNTTLTVQCGSLSVPLDYAAKASNRSINLELVKLLAPVQPSKGSIQINFGGPGVPTREDLVALGPVLQ